MNKFWQIVNSGDGKAELLLYGVISECSWWGDEVTPKQFADDLKALGNIQELTVRINSGGGDVFAATAIYTLLKDHQARVVVKIDGYAASSATIVVMAGDTVQAPSSAMLMIHNPQAMLFGYYKKDELEKMADVLDSVKDTIINAYVAKTKRSREDLAAMMDVETWMTAEQAKAEGFVDEILFEEDVDATVTNDGRFMVVNSVLLDLSKYQTRPQMAVPTPRGPVSVPAHSKPVKEDEPLNNLDELKEKHPDLYNQLVTNTQDAERKRLQAIDEIAPTVDPALVAKAKYEEPVTAEALALVSLKADAAKGKQYLQAREGEVQPAGQVPATPTANPATNDVVDDATIQTIADSANAKRKERK